MERNKSYKSVFVNFPGKSAWLEFVTKCSRGTKSKKPIKFEASVVWRSDKSLTLFSDLRGSFSSENEAYEFLSKSISEYGGETAEMSKVKLAQLKEEFGYPEGRHNYLFDEPVI